MYLTDNSGYHWEGSGNEIGGQSNIHLFYNIWILYN